MNRKLLPLLSCTLLFSLAIADVDAGEQVKCEKKLRPARSKISVDVEDLRVGAVYTAIVKSGIKSTLSSKAANALGVVEFDYDSNKKDVLAGATAIAPQFIGTAVDVLVTDAVGNVIAETGALCRVK